MSTEDPGAPTPFAKYNVGDLFASTQDEIDDDHTGRVRTTPAGSLWEVASIDRYTYDASARAPAGSVCAYTLVCPATGAAITPYTPIAGETYGHWRDEMEHFIPIDLPGQTWPTLRLQLIALCEIKDVLMTALDDFGDAAANLDQPIGIDSELVNVMKTELRDRKSVV